jgi:hypothetical protein
MAKVQAPALILAPAADRFVDPAPLSRTRGIHLRRRLLDVAGGYLAIFEDYRQIPALLQEFLAIFRCY